MTIIAKCIISGESAGGKLMAQHRSKAYSVVLAVFTVIQMILVFLNFAYAYWGTYAANKPSNIWSQIWDKGAIGLWTILFSFASLVIGILGLVFRRKGPAAQTILSIVLLAIQQFTGFSLIMAIGSHF